MIFVALESEIGDLRALLVATVPPLVWAIVEFARKRRVDAVAMLVLAGILLSLLAFFGGGGIAMLQLRENLVGGLIGLVFLGSIAIGRPLIYYLARASIRRTHPTLADRFVASRSDPEVRRATLIMTLAWGTALVGECALASMLVFALPIESYLIVAPILGYAVLGAMMAWSFWFGRRRLGPILGGEE